MTVPDDFGSQVVRLLAARSEQGATSKLLNTVWADEIQISFDIVGLVDGYMRRTGLTVLYGESNAGKTFVTIDIACHIAAGLPWRGMRVEQGIVVYIAAEAPRSVEHRIYAWKRHHGVEHLPLLVVKSGIDLLTDDCNLIVDLVRDTIAPDMPVRLVVIDTLARSMIGNENSPEDMGRYVAAAAAIREAADTHVLIVHHTGKDTARGARGHSSLRAATDVELEVEPGSIRMTKSRDGAAVERLGFKLEVVELGASCSGRMETTCVAIPTEASRHHPRGSGL